MPFQSLIIYSRFLKQDPETGNIEQCYAHTPALSAFITPPEEKEVQIHVLDQYYEFDGLKKILTKRVWYPSHQKASFEVNLCNLYNDKKPTFTQLNAKDFNLMEEWFLRGYGKLASYMQICQSLDETQNADLKDLEKVVLSTPFPDYWLDLPVKTSLTMGDFLDQMGCAYFARGDFGNFNILKSIITDFSSFVSIEEVFAIWKSDQRCGEHLANHLCLHCILNLNSKSCEICQQGWKNLPSHIRMAGDYGMLKFHHSAKKN